MAAGGVAAGDVVSVLGAAPLPNLTGIDAVLVDGHPEPRPAAELNALAALVEEGASLVAVGAAPHAHDDFWTRLLGVVATDPLPDGEYFAKLAGDRALTRRLETEWAVQDRVETLAIVAGTAEPVLVVNIGYRDHVVVTVAHRGRGRVVTSGLGLSEAAWASLPLRALLRRALAPAHPASDRDLGLAVVGYGPFGGMGYLHASAARAVPGLDIVAVLDPSDARRKAAEADWAGVRAYETLPELLADDGVDVAVVATPPSSHAQLAEALLTAGKHVVAEKPLCLTVSEADRLIALAADRHLTLTVHQNRRWDQDFLALRRAVDGGLLGELFNVETFVGSFEHPCRHWHSEQSVSGGAVYDWGSHHVDWILQLYGTPPARVTAHGHKRVWHDVTNLDQMRLRMEWPDGREAQFVVSDVAGIRPPKFYLQGTRGTLAGHYRERVFERIEPGRGFVREPAHHAEAPVELDLARYESGYGLISSRLPLAKEQRFGFHRNLADHLHLGDPLAVTPQSVRQVIAVLEAAQLSATSGGRPVDVPQ